MLPQQLELLVREVQQNQCESQTIEVKLAAKGTPERLYDTLSSFSNQDGGGIILFGLDEGHGFSITGVYDPQDLQKRVAEQGEQMNPKVRPLFTVCIIDGKAVVSAEIAECDMFERPCFYIGKGKIKGSFIRVGESDKPMTEYEVYNYEVFKRKIQDELRTDPRAEMDQLNPNLLAIYLAKLREAKPNLSPIPDNQILTLQGIIANGRPTVAGELFFGIYPQALFPQYSIIASVVPGKEIGELGGMGERFLDDKRIDGTLPQMLEDAITFVTRNMKKKLIVDDYGRRNDITEYPIKAIREALLNALVHRDYSVHTETSPIRLLMFEDRLEIENPGGLFGRGTLEQLGEEVLDIRNPYIAGALEIFIQSENRYSGIPTMRREMREHGLRPPEFQNLRGAFRVIFYNQYFEEKEKVFDPVTDRLLSFCVEPRSREELAKEFGYSAPTYFINTYVRPLVKQGRIAMTLPRAPRSKNQRYYTVTNIKDIKRKLVQSERDIQKGRTYSVEDTVSDMRMAVAETADAKKK